MLVAVAVAALGYLGARSDYRNALTVPCSPSRPPGARRQSEARAAWRSAAVRRHGLLSPRRLAELAWTAPAQAAAAAMMAAMRCAAGTRCSPANAARRSYSSSGSDSEWRGRAAPAPTSCDSRRQRAAATAARAVRPIQLGALRPAFGSPMLPASARRSLDTPAPAGCLCTRSQGRSRS